MILAKRRQREEHLADETPAALTAAGAEVERRICTVRGGRRKAATAFTEQGVALLSGALRSERAGQVNIAIMRAFISLRGMLMQDNDLARRILTLAAKYDKQ